MGLAGAMAFFQLKETITLTASGHRENCECDNCLAAYGDKEAFLRVWLKTDYEQSRS